MREHKLTVSAYRAAFNSALACGEPTPDVCPCEECRRLRADHDIPEPAPVSVSERSDDA